MRYKVGDKVDFILETYTKQKVTGIILKYRYTKIWSWRWIGKHEYLIEYRFSYSYAGKILEEWTEIEWINEKDILRVR